MTKRADSLLGEASQEELTACIRLLALSIAHHRASGNFVPFRESAEYLRDGANDPEGAELLTGGSNVVEDALELIRTVAAESKSGAPAMAASAPEEKRRQLRINVTAPIKVIWPGDDAPTPANLQNISWGGAAITADAVKMNNGDTLRVLIPGTRGQPIDIEAKFLRSWKMSEGPGEGFAVRFSSLATDDEDALEEVLQLLAQSADSDGLREHARLTQRLDIQFDGEELHASLDDISAGGLGVTVPDPLQIGQSLQAVISTFDEGYTLKLRARVVRQEAISMGQTKLYQAGLKFEHPPEELSELTGELLSRMVASRR
jgi:PilZ domain